MTLEGKQIDRYHILHLLGSGGMGDVYLAEDPRIGQQVAVKVIRTEMAQYLDENSPKDVARLFKREAKVIVKLDHPHILPLYDYGEESIGNLPVVYLVMPYRPEGSLSDWLRRRKRKELLAPQDVAYIINQAADALQHAHDHHVIHQDVKPSNFLVRTHKDELALPDLLLSDFGIARLSSATSSVSQSVRGTPSYMAPEQWEGEPVSATDQYALAVMAYELLTGKLPFQGGPGKMMYQHINVPPPPPSSVNPCLASDIDEIIMRALAKEPERRYASLKAFGDAFQQSIQALPEAQSWSLNSQIESKSDIVSSAADDEAQAGLSTLNNSSTQAIGSNSETYVKSRNIPTLPLSPVPETQEEVVPELIISTQKKNIIDEKQQSNLLLNTGASLSKPPMSKKRPLALITLIVLVIVLMGGGVAYAALAFTGVAQGGHGNSMTSRSLIAAGATSASITIVPATKVLQNTLSIEAVTGTPDETKHQFQGARILSNTTPSYVQTANATGQGTIPGTHASGIVCIDNFDTAAPITLLAGSVYNNTRTPPFFHMVLDASETVPPAPSNTTWSQKCGPAHVLEVGTIGNNGFNNNQGGTLSYSVFNNPAFNNGKDPQNYVAVQQSDIDTAANALINANAPNSQQLLQPQLRANERFIDNPQCNPNVRSNHQAGDNATSVTVSVSFTCTGEVYDHDGVRSFAAQLLTQQATSQLGNGYAPVGNITTNVNNATITDVQLGTVTIIVDTQGKWVYKFTNTQVQALAKLVVGKKKDQSQSILLEQTGVAQAIIRLSGGDGITLPADASKITIVVNGG